MTVLWNTPKFRKNFHKEHLRMIAFTAFSLMEIEGFDLKSPIHNKYDSFPIKSSPFLRGRGEEVFPPASVISSNKCNVCFSSDTFCCTQPN